MSICKEGWPFIGGLAAAGIALFIGARMLSSPVLFSSAGVALLLAAFCAYFFRDPARRIPMDPGWVLSPADGRILEVAEERDPASGAPVWVVRIFLSVFDPHLQRAPVGGRVKAIRYTKGKFLDARDPQAAFENERNRIEIERSDAPAGATIVVTQIAGLIARRIVCWVKEGQVLQPGEKIGLIRFGSQVDISLPKSATLRVKAGDYVTAGDTALAER